MERRLRYFGHDVCNCCSEEHYCAVAAAIHELPTDWKRSPGRPSHTWLRAIESDLRLSNIGPSYIWKMASFQEHWHLILDVTVLKKNMPQREREFCLSVVETVNMLIVVLALESWRKGNSNPSVESPVVDEERMKQK